MCFVLRLPAGCKKHKGITQHTQQTKQLYRVVNRHHQHQAPQGDKGEQLDTCAFFPQHCFFLCFFADPVVLSCVQAASPHLQQQINSLSPKCSSLKNTATSSPHRSIISCSGYVHTGRIHDNTPLSLGCCCCCCGREVVVLVVLPLPPPPPAVNLCV